jgi:hypothetical protein
MVPIPNCMQVPDSLLVSVIFFITGSSLTLVARFHTQKSWVTSAMKIMFPVVAFTCLAISSIGLLQGASKIMALTGITLSILFGLVSHFYVIRKNYYTVKSLTPKIISFTKDADNDVLRLIGGDFDFFGKTPGDISTNKQFVDLQNRKFFKIEILCKWPTANMVRVRYGKLIKDLGSNVEIRCYDNCSTDLKIRGRIKKDLKGIEKMLIYQKIRDDQYEAIETDYNEEQCQLYLRIWNASWNNARQIDGQTQSDWVMQYQNFN